MPAEADALCGARYGESGAERVHSRQRVGDHDYDTQAGTTYQAVPKLPEGDYFRLARGAPSAASRAGTQVVSQCYLKRGSDPVRR